MSNPKPRCMDLDEVMSDSDSEAGERLYEAECPDHSLAGEIELLDEAFDIQTETNWQEFNLPVDNDY